MDENEDALTWEASLPPGLITVLDDLAAEAAEYALKSHAANTIRAYRADWSHFEAWCAKHHLSPLPAAPQTVGLYLTDLKKTFKISTIARRIVTISEMHRAKELDSPTRHPGVHRIWRGIKRDKREEPVERKRPTLTSDIQEMLAALPPTRSGIRDRALLLLGFAGGMRRSELAAITVRHISFTAQGLVVTIPWSKTDQEGKGRDIGIPYGRVPDTCPVRAVRAWLDAGKISEGPLFRKINRHNQLATTALDPKSVAIIVKRALQRAGRTNIDEYSGHSLRAGFATQAVLSGAQEREIQQQTGHQSLEVLRRYIRAADLFKNNPAAKLGL